jgi:hypothetical protein
LKKNIIKTWVLAIIVTVVAIFLPAAIFNKWAEAIFFFFCHWFIREQYPHQYHHIVPSICRVITASVLFFGISLILPFTLSLVSAIPINYAVGWIGNTKRDADFYEVHYKQLKQKLEQQKTFNVDTCTETELRTRCHELRLSETNEELAVAFFIKKTKHSIIADELCINEKSVTMRKRRMREQLNT